MTIRQSNKLNPFFVFLMLVCALTVSAKDFKQLAGDAGEIDSMRLPAPESLAVKSKSALIPIRGEAIEIPVEAAENFKLMLLAPNSRDWKIWVATPGADSFADLRTTGKVWRSESVYGFDGAQFPAEVFAFETIEKGVLRVRIENADFSGEAVGYLVAASDSPYLLRSHLDTLETVTGREIGFAAALTDNAENIFAGSIRTAAVEIRFPNGASKNYDFLPDENGFFRASFTPAQIGKHTAQITARGVTPDGAEFIRTGEHLFHVAAPAEIGSFAKARQVDEVRFAVNIPVSGLKNKTIAHAEVWARDASGNESAIAWIGGMTQIESSKRGEFVTLFLDSRWLARAGAKAVYELRNVRLQDADFHVTVGTADLVKLPALDLPAAAQNFNGEITDEMRTGKRPEIQISNAVGGKLMLVHGYCSGANPWNAAQFSDSISFLDANANRTHDQFAQRIRNFGAAYPSFGIVAHSQGGAAALHLYTYYWSGLDSATGARLIQSVGTPYQGTSLAGNLAVLGQIFGAGCGSNYDLTYSGASAWLAGIPSWARAKVFYHTTSFADVWWRYDYCNLASDVVLSDPDDGVIERAKGQLSGANNLGHKTGWCHTAGMRDPAQTSDSSRNSNMNAYAAR